MSPVRPASSSHLLACLTSHSRITYSSSQAISDTQLAEPTCVAVQAILSTETLSLCLILPAVCLSHFPPPDVVFTHYHTHHPRLVSGTVHTRPQTAYAVITYPSPDVREGRLRIQ